MVTAKKTRVTAAEVVPKPKAKVPARKTVAVPAAAPRAAVKKTAAKKPAVPKANSSTTATPATVTPEQRHHYIEVAAFYVAQRRGFAPGNPADDWATAESEVDGLIASGHFNP